jgi:hypothetical protein
MAFTERMTEDLQCFFEIKTSILTSFLRCVQHRQIVQGNRNIGVSLTQLLPFHRKSRSVLPFCESGSTRRLVERCKVVQNERNLSMTVAISPPVRFQSLPIKLLRFVEGCYDRLGSLPEQPCRKLRQCNWRHLPWPGTAAIFARAARLD